MTPLFQKLNLKDRREIVVLNAPTSFEAELAALDGVTIRRDLEGGPTDFLMAFVTRLDEIAALAAQLPENAPGDALVWLVYPKGTSKRYTCDFNRDTGWKAVGEAGFEPVRQVAIDADWTAMRFRRAAYIRQMKRDPKRALSEVGKEKTQRAHD